METNQFEPETNQKPQGFFQSSTAKIIMVGLLTLVLLIPLQYVKSLIFERSERQKDVVNEINEKWGGSVYVYGPILKVPYKYSDDVKVVDEKTKKVTYQTTYYTDYAYFFPNELTADANIKTEEKERGNYQSVVFTSKLGLKGKYSTPNFSSSNIPAENILWDKATIIIKTNNIKGIMGGVNVSIGGHKHAFEPVATDNPRDSVASLETRPFNIKDILATASASFDLNISYNGSEKIRIVPIGKQTTAKMESNWHSPSFNGSFLPATKHITDKGFTAAWSISYLNRSFTQNHFGTLPDLSDYTFDVDFLIPVDQYQQTERASKYGFLVIGLTFLVFFLIQSISKISIHIFQYSMIGLALIMFYTLLISITEHSSFMTAYLISGIAVVVMISLYSISILKNIKFPLFIGAALSALYSFIYVIIQLEDYALLVGSIGLFLILAAVMYFSRKIDWGGNTTVVTQ